MYTPEWPGWPGNICAPVQAMAQAQPPHGPWHCAPAAAAAAAAAPAAPAPS